jgi:hypothetical protein
LFECDRKFPWAIALPTEPLKLGASFVSTLDSGFRALESHCNNSPSETELLSGGNDSLELEIGQFFPSVELVDEVSRLFTELGSFRRKSYSR